MLFNSLEFAIFFVLVCGLYWSLSRWFRVQNLLLLGASYVFYGWWDVRFLFLIVLTTCVDYTCAMMVERGRISRRARVGASGMLLLSGLAFVVMQWEAIQLVWQGFVPNIAIQSELLWPALSSLEWRVAIACSVAVLLGNLAYPWAIRIPDRWRRPLFLGISIAINLSILGFFKYYNFFAESFSQVIESIFGLAPSSWTLKIILPVGISFYTFQSMSYVVDVYRRKMEPTLSLTTYATYVTFFPQLVAGPIERGAHLLPQFLRPRTVTWEKWREGMWLIFWGLFKKMVVADNMAVIVNNVFGPYDGADPSFLIPTDGLRLLLAVYAFALQIYGDFSGYTDIARGTARLLGFDIMLNFNLPYIAISPSDFWRRWHISLSSWLRDYLYIPLGGNRKGTFKTYRNLLITMLLGGLWHGAAWTFVLWGLFHGLLLVGYRILAPGIDRLALQSYTDVSVSNRIKGCLVRLLPGLVMFHFTCFGWLLFRAQNLTAVRVFIESMVLHPIGSAETWTVLHDIVFYSWFMILFQIIQASMQTLNPMQRWPWFVRLNVWVFVIMSIWAFSPHQEVAFIYFAF